MIGKLWTFSNALSLLRVILVLPIAILLLSPAPGDRTIAMILIVLAVATDFFDGYFARHLQEITDTGKILDPIADKIAIAAVCVILALKGEMPVWFLVAAVVRDLCILGGGLYLKRKKSILLQSNWTGKWTVGVLAMYIFVLLLRIDNDAWLTGTLLYLSAAMLAVSFALYVRRFAQYAN